MLWWSVLLPPISAFNFGRGLLEFRDSWVWSYWDEYHTVGVGAIYCMIDMFLRARCCFYICGGIVSNFGWLSLWGFRVRCDTLSHCDFFLSKIWFLLITRVYSYSVSCGERLQASKVLQPQSNHPRTNTSRPSQRKWRRFGLEQIESWNDRDFGIRIGVSLCMLPAPLSDSDNLL